MSNNKSASLEARIKNSKDLLEVIKTLGLYSPTSPDLKAEAYSEFVRTTEESMTPYKDCSAELKTASSDHRELMNDLVGLSVKVRSEVAEMKGEDSDQYRNVNSIVKLITGQNIKDHFRAKQLQKKSLKEGDPVPVSSSVSQLDSKSRNGNFKSLISLLRTYDFYAPADGSIAISSLERIESKVSDSLVNLAAKDAAATNSRSLVIGLFDNKGGLKDRAKRARLHVKRQYGRTSPEYRSLVNKHY